MQLFLLHTEGNPFQRDGFGKDAQGFSSHKEHQYILFPLASRRLGITFCLPHIQVADTIAFSMARKMAFPTTLSL